MSKIIVPAVIEQLPIVQEFIENKLEENDCSMKIMMQISIAVEEIFVNIVHYAYDTQCGEATIVCEITEEPSQIVVQFIDEGKRFNPLEKDDADVTLSAEEREIGGLGIFMVKKSMTEMEYEYKEGKNILTIKKDIV